MKQQRLYRIGLLLPGMMIMGLLIASLLAREPGTELAAVSVPQAKPILQAPRAQISQLPQELISRVDGLGRGSAPPGDSGTTSNGDYARLVDSFNAITVDVPRAWSQIDMGTWTYHAKPVGRFIAASTDLPAFLNSKNVPGVFFGASTVLLPDYDAIGLAGDQPMAGNGCNHRGLFDYYDQFYQGRLDYFIDCPGGSPNLLVITSKPANQSYMSLLRISIGSKADLEAARHILSTFQVLGSPDHDNDY